MDKELFRLQGIRPVMLLLAGLSLLQSAAIIGQALFLAKSIAILFEGQTVQMAYQPLALFLVLLVARHTIVWLQKKVAGRFAEAAGESLQGRVLSRLFERGPRFAASEGSGKLVTLVLEGVDRVRTYLELSVPRTLDMVFVTLPLLAFVYMQDVISGLILMVTMPVLIGFFIVLGLAARKQADKQWRSYRMLSHHFTDSLRGLATLRFLGRSKDHGETVERVSDQYRSATMRTLRVAFLSSLALDFFSMLSVAFVAVGLGLRLIEGNVGFETALVILILAPEYFLPVRMLGSDYHASLDGKEALGTIHTIIDRAATNEHKAEPQVTDNQTSLTGVWNRTITLSDIRVVGEDGRQLLGEVSAELGSNTRRVGIVGASGAGKSTLLGVLGGFFDPEAGVIQVNGHPITGDTKQEWQRQIAYIPQHPYVFNQSLADNIRFYEPEATQEQVEQVIRDVGLEELVDSLPNGCDEIIGEGGRTLSGGQAQRVALGRALLGNRPVILLDEPTAHLDIETEWELKQTMLSVLGDRRVFLATHRLHWMRDMDWIWVMDQGRLVEAGTFEQLVAQKNVFYRLLTASAEGEKG
ncbi:MULTISPECIES: thiol reductant ABC exporter subunit CydD [Bacillales]|uniref:thiol reductant ABC exporter subunit CydD n=1 Tax=Bacillales TaxID=1385 RepID=UPI00034BA6F8|nr:MULTISPECIES: thiol reductant ABC exporter subunit CydD [Bacillales]KMZ44670.1 ABC transporter ATP-binding protein [Bacillus sp. FJAT-27238]